MSENVASGKPAFPAQQGRSVTVADPAVIAVAPFPKVWRLLSTDRAWEAAVPWSVTLDCEGSGTDGVADTPGAIADVRWGIGGVRHRAFVDWRKGARFVVVGATLDLDLWMLNPADWGVPDNDANGIPDVEGWPATFRASAVPGAVPQGASGCAPTLSVAIGDVESTAVSPLVTVPPFARRAMVRVRDDVGSQPQIILEWGMGLPVLPPLALCAQDAAFASPNRNVSALAQSWWEVPAEATFCYFYNATGRALTFCRVIFEIGL